MYGKEVRHKCVKSLMAFRFSIFYCGCKQPKSIHISLLRQQRYEEKGEPQRESQSFSLYSQAKAPPSGETTPLTQPPRTCAHTLSCQGTKPFMPAHKTPQSVPTNYFQGLIIYFQTVKIYFQSLIIYFQALKIVL